MFCPRCRIEYRDGFERCSECGATIETFDDVVACPHCGYDSRSTEPDEDYGNEERWFDLVDLFVAIGLVPAFSV